MASSSQGNTEIISPIIYPKTFTGSESVRVVSFMMCAEDLLNTCYVMRKDNWSESILLYQRLIDQSKIQKVRSYLEKKGETFYNNIIVALPDSISFRSDDNNYKSVEEIIEFDKQYKLILPNEMNTICVIDGQHRIFAHYESGTQNDQEMRIAELRKERHLLVTGLIFPKDMSQEKRARIQSAIFLDINQNAKPVPPNILLQIRRIQNPIGDESLAQSVIECLNKDGVFKERLQISSLDSGKIKTASIVRFALRYLITINPPRGKKSLYSYWTGKKEDLLQKDECAIQEYVNFCTKIIKYYFAAIKKNRQEDWYDSESKLLSVISINGFIIALTRQLEINGVKDFSFYDKIFRGWSIKFSKKEFPYTSSQYRKFSTQILHDAFGFDGDTISRI